MGKETGISWTDATWNIARGCTKVDSDCKYCYMYRESFDNSRYNPRDIVKTKTVFNLPLTLKQPSKVFTCSLTDFFHEGCDSFRDEAWDIIRRCPQHIFQILTKRPERIYKNLPDFWDEIADRCWIGTSIGSNEGLKRLNDLVTLVGNPKKTPKLFLSLEPLHGEIDLDSATFKIQGIDKVYQSIHFINWVIIGGESGNETGKYLYRPCKLEWIEKIVNQCRERHIPVFVKQMGTYLSKEMKLSSRHGADIDEFPKHLQIREFPKK